MPMIKNIPADGTIVALDTTPLLGGQGREGIAHLGDNAGTAGVILEGHAVLPDGGVPEEDSEGWTALLTATADTGAVVEIADLPDFIRVGAAATADVSLEGVQ